ncbi:MAG: magnesium transporter [Phenylobacterium sp.]|uniref:magnesium transporter n=1 Tax=Phenylobacterium sp. TaxID=1871053 RepID=UPI0025EA95E5|nr:magnesium transporter [Phenylobacterium sp.]MCA3738435.1 magnesium transporter [Phenylobacterium sp.]MCA4915064.1 magnesium transporter [Phenylobacterium sp.]
MSRDAEHPLRDDLVATEAAEDLEDLALGDDYALNPDFVALVVDAADRGDAERLRELLAALHPADVADLMGFLSASDREEVMAHLDPEALAEILAEIEPEIREDLLERMPSATLVRALGEMDSDDAVDLMEDLEADKRAQVLAALPDIDRAAIETSLAYEDETAGRLMQREVASAPQFWTVGQALDHFLKAGDEMPELFFDVYVVDPSHRPLGGVPVSRLLRHDRDTPLARIMEPLTEIPVGMDQEEAAYIFNKYHLISAPVVEPGGRLVGQLTVDDIVGVIREEGEEDILALAGVSDVGRDASLAGAVRSRLPWLVLNLGTAAVASSVIGAFQGVIAQVIALAILMPIVSSLGGNAGTQTLAVAVRALSSRELNAANSARIILREVMAGLLNGSVLAVLMAAAVLALFQDPRLAVTVGLAIIANFFVAALAGILAPIILDRLGRDPAVSSSVLVTFATDFMGFLALLGIASLILL